MSYTQTSPYIAVRNFGTVTSGDLAFTQIASQDTDWAGPSPAAGFSAFADTAMDPYAISTPLNLTDPNAGLLGMEWGGFDAGAWGAGSEVYFTIDYNVTVTDPGEAITSLDQLYVVDTFYGPGVSATATEQAFDSNGNLVATVAWSEVNGSSAAANLSVGYQQLHIVLAITESVSSATGNDSSEVDISTIDQLFGQSAITSLASITSTVFCDKNGNGTQDTGDFGMAGVTVELLDSTGTQVLATTTTDVNGQYTFGNLMAGTYQTEVIAPSGDTFSTSNNGLDSGVVLSAGQNDIVAPTGLIMPGPFNVHVYLDTNDNNTQDSGEPNLAGISVELENGGGTILSTATTDANGNVSFAGLMPGTYEAVIATPTGDTVTQNTNIGTPVALESCGTINGVEGLFPTSNSGGGGTPDLALIKTVTGVIDANNDGLTDAGDVINYNIEVVNTGSVVLTGVAVTDPLTGGVLDSGDVLSPGQTLDFTTSYTITQADINNNGNQNTSSPTQIYVSNMALGHGYEIVNFTSSGSWGGGSEYAGQQVLTANVGTAYNASSTFTAYAWCVDVFHNINIGANSIVYTLQSLGVPDAGDIAKLAAWGDAQLASGPNNLISAAVQSDIWMREYGVGLAAGSDTALVNEVNYIDTTVLPTLSAVVGSALVGVDQNLAIAQSLYTSNPTGSGEITNTATATSDQVGPLTSSVSTPINYAPGMALTKTVTGVVDNNHDGFTDAGDTIDYDVRLINTGDVTLTGVNVIDPLTHATLAAGATIAVGATVDYATTYNLTQADVDADGNPAASGLIVNTATASSDETPTQTATATTPVQPNPNVSIVKMVTSVGGVAGDPAATYAHEVINYNIVVSNTGNETLTGVVVTDPMTGLNDTIGTLAVGSSTTIAASYTVSQSDLDQNGNPAGGGDIVNTATVTDNQTGPQSSTATTGVTESPGVSIVKTVTSVGGVAGDPAVTSANEVIDYNIVVSNTGNETLTGVVVTDPMTGLSDTIGTLAVGSSTTIAASYTVTAADLSNDGNPAASGDIINTATVTDNQTGPQSSTATTPVSPPQVDLAVAKTDGKTQVVAGSIDTYTITVTNNGPGTVSSFSMVDNLPSNLLNPVWGTPSAGTYNSTTDVWSGLSLAPGKSVSITLTGTIAAAAPITNATTFTAAGVGGDGSESGAATITTENGEIIVVLSSNIANPIAAGQEVSGIQFTLSGSPGAALLQSAAGTLIDIASGGSVTPDSGAITHWGIAESGSTITLATAGTGAVGGKPIDLIIGSGPYTNANPSITGRNPQIQNAGTFVISAPGITAGTTISGVSIEFGTGPDAVVAAGQSGSGGGGGTITNTVTVAPLGGQTDTNPSNNTATDTDTIVTPTPGVSIAKMVTSVGGVAGDPAVTYAGEVIDYNIVVSNTGNQTLTGVVVTDPMAKLVDTIGTLAVGSSTTIAASYTVTSSDLCNDGNPAASGDIINTATVTDNQTGPQSSTVSTPVSPQVDLAVTKTDGKTQVVAGSTDTYTITVTNNGPGTVSSFSMVDNLPSNLLNPVWGTASAGTYNPTTDVWSGLSLASGQSVSITLTGTIAAPAGNASATTFTAAGVGGDGAESGSATITTANGQIIIVLSSNIANAMAAGQEVSGLQFTLSGSPGAALLQSAAGTLIDIASGGSVTPDSGTITHWGIAESGSTITLATAGTGAVGGKPIDLIIGSGPYTNANPSITGRNPQIQNAGTFVISAPGITAGTTISGVSIEFGTGPDAVVAAAQSGSGGGGTGTITNTVTVMPLGGQIDTNLSNNTASDTDTIGAAAATFTAHVYNDANDNSTQNTGEANLSGITVDLETAGGTILTAGTTDASGNVSFTGLAPGSYQVAVVTPAGDIVTQHTNVNTVNTLASGGTANAIEGLYQPASFGVHVYNDSNDNGTQNSGEANAAGVTVELENAGGTVVATSTTDANGNVNFTGLAPGSYQVAVVTPSGDVVTQHTNVGVVNTLAEGGSASAIEGLFASQVDLAITKTDGKVSVTAGAIDTYTITVTNNGGATVSSFSMVDNLPSNLLNPSFGTPSAGSYNATTGVWSGVSLAPGQSVSITATGTVAPGAVTTTSTTYSASGSGGDGSESGTATITTENGEIIVVLSSNIANPTAAGQEVSGIQFTLGNSPGSAVLENSLGTLINIGSGGAVTPYSGAITHWGVAESGSTLTLATAGTGAVGGKPIDLIIGSGPYNNANPSITGRDPQIQNAGTFVLSAPGVTAGTSISNVRIEFGTGPDSVLAAAQSSTSGGGSITNTATVTPLGGLTDSNPGNNTATDTDTILQSGSCTVSYNGTTPTGSLSSLYGAAERIEFQYAPSNTVSLKQIQAGLASVSGSNANAMAFMEISNNSNPYSSNATIYFEGEVQSGDKIFADATLNPLTDTPVAAPNNQLSTTAGADLYAYVFTSQSAFQLHAAPVQSMAYNTSGSQAMHFGDRIASLTVLGYVGTNGGHLVS